MMKGCDATYRPESDQPIVGQVLSSISHEPLVGVQIIIQVERHTGVPALGKAVSQLDGVFAIPLAPHEAEMLERSNRHYTLSVRNRFGRTVHRWQGIASRRLLEPLEIVVEPDAAEDHPLPPERPDPFEVFRRTFESEIAVLKYAGVGTLDQLLDLDLGAFSRQHELSHARLAAFRLAADAGAPEQLSGDDARVTGARSAYAGERSWSWWVSPAVEAALEIGGGGDRRASSRGGTWRQNRTSLR